jgi:EpsI family protein
VRARAVTVAALVGLAAVLAGGLSRATEVADGRDRVITRPLEQLPMTIGDWSAHLLPALDEQSKRVLGADAYLNRRYTRDESKAVDLFVAYYGNQRQGDAIHSPRNCLPGAGWRPVATSTIALPVDGGRNVTVNRYVIEKGRDRLVVFYWYHGRGRVVANEYANKAWLMVDALRTGRSDGALVRAMTPATHDAEHDAMDFVRAVFAPLSQALP